MSNIPAPVSEVLQSLVNLLGWGLLIVAPIVLARLGLWIAVKWNIYKQSQPENIRLLLETAAKFGADFAEKVGPTLKEFGKDKMEAAVDAATRWLAAQGYEIDNAPIKEAIEVILFNSPDKYPSSKK